MDCRICKKGEIIDDDKKGYYCMNCGAFYEWVDDSAYNTIRTRRL